jgi:hypothetical protein
MQNERLIVDLFVWNDFKSGRNGIASRHTQTMAAANTKDFGTIAIRVVGPLMRPENRKNE